MFLSLVGSLIAFRIATKALGRLTSYKVVCPPRSRFDGDTIKVKRLFRIRGLRLSSIDAPETAQPLGKEALKTLLKICPVGSRVHLSNVQKDRYGRYVASVVVGGVDLSAYMVSKGMAYVYPDYCMDDTLYHVEAKARRKKRGVWGLKNAVKPWDFRG